MNRKRRKVDLSSVMFQTSQNKDYINRVKRLIDNPDKNMRAARQECTVCFYGSKMGGAMCTETECGICDKEIYFGSTCVDILCPGCAKKHVLCKHCGADLNLKNRRKL